MKTAGISLGRLWRTEFEPEETYPDLEAGEGLENKVPPESLSALSPERRARTRFYTVHMPAWTAEQFPDHLKVTVLREPVARTVSHLRHIARMPDAPNDITEIYDDPGWHSRLVDYQTRLLSEDSDDHLRFSHWRNQVMEEVKKLSDDDRATIAYEGFRFLTTAVEQPHPIDGDSLERAMRRLETFDVVGTTERLEEFVASVADRMGWRGHRAQAHNAASNRETVPEALLARIEADTRHDTILWEHARTMA